MVPPANTQIKAISIDPNLPLVLVDADEVLVHFAIPFRNYLLKRGYELKLNGYTLQNAIFNVKSNRPVVPHTGKNLVINFIKEETHRQPATPGAIDSIKAISKYAQIIIISNVPRYAHKARVTNLKALDLPFPFVSNEGPKGPALKQICDQIKKPSVFIDDNSSQILSAKKFVPHLYRFYFSGCEFVRNQMPISEAATHNPKSWKEIEAFCYDLFT